MKQIKVILALICSFAFALPRSASAEECCLNLPSPPENSVDVSLTAYYPSYAKAYSIFTAKVFNPATGIAPIPTTPPADLYAAWCVDAGTDITVPQRGVFASFSGVLWSSCDPDLNAKLKPGYSPTSYAGPNEWRKVNWIINHRSGIGLYEVQHAIWNLVGGPPDYYAGLTLKTNQVLALLAGADQAVNNEGWNPQCGDKVAAVFEVYTSVLVQLVILEVPCPCTSLGDYVWEDTNRDGVQNEPAANGINGVTVKLLNAGGNVVKTTVTANDSNGNPGYYLFPNLVPGNYRVEFVRPPGYVFTSQNNGGATPNNTDSDADPSTGITGPISLAYGNQDLTWDAGLYQTAALGDYVWHDLNANGIQEAGEPGIPDVTVELFDCTTMNVLATTNTDANGFYLFGNLAPGCYAVGFATPFGFTPTPANQGGDAADSDAVSGKTGSYTLVGGQTDLTVDAGFYRPAGLGDYVWLDVNGNGVQETNEPPVANVTVNLRLCVNSNLVATVATGDGTNQPLGYYEFKGLTPGVGYYVEFADTNGLVLTVPFQGGDTNLDSNADGANGPGTTACIVLAAGEFNPSIDAGLYQPASLGNYVWVDQNGNGQQDSGEAPVPGVTVELYKCETNVAIATLATDTNGNYLFTGLAPGSYYVKFILPSGYVFTTVDVGDNAADSDAQTDGSTICVTLLSGETNLTVDAGLYKAAALGDFVWEDLNANGVQDAGEPGIPGVTVNLFKCDQSLAGTTATDANGNYLFDNLAPGCYYVTFGSPAGYQASPVNAGGDDAKDSDSNGGTTGQYTLASGDVNLTVDAGFYKPASLGDFVWNDANKNGVQDTGEAGIPNVLATLYRCDNSVVGSISTDANGYYLFSDLLPGCYYVTFGSPAGYVATAANAGVDDAKDSDSNGGTTGQYTLASGESNLTVDAGFYQCQPSFTFTKTPKNEVVRSGGLATYIYTVVNTGCAPLTDIQVVDDYGTPDYADDDIVVGVIPRLEPGETNELTSSVYLPITLCGETTCYTGYTGCKGGKPNCDWTCGTKYWSGSWYMGCGTSTSISGCKYGKPKCDWTCETKCATTTTNETKEAGTLITQVDQDGNYRFIFIQSMNRNDNSYGTNSIGWKPNRPHRFKDLVNSDHAEFTIKNAAGQTVLKVDLDYLSATSDSPSGYACLGVSGGDGGMLAGPESAILSWNSSLAQNLLKPEFTDPEFKINSPALSHPKAGLWEYRMIYEVTVDASVFGSAGFGSVQITDQHNSPPKTGLESFTPIDCGKCVVNVAIATATYNGTQLAATAEAKVCTYYQNLKGSLGDRVWLDADQDGKQDDGETGLSGVTVKLYDCSGNYLKSTTTTADGKYLFTGLTAGSYKVRFILPSGYSFTVPHAGTDDKDSDVSDSAGGYTDCITLAAGEQNLTVDAGLKKNAATACLGNFVWYDKNRNGLQDSGEAGAACVKVELLTCSGSVLKSTTTTSSGTYQFSNLAAGSYKVRFTAPYGYEFTGANKGANDAIDSDSVSGVTDCITLAAGESNQTVDAGLVGAKLCFTTYTQGGWGCKPSGQNPGMLLAYCFDWLYPNDLWMAGGKLKFSSASCVQNFLPSGGAPWTLNSRCYDPRSTSAGVFAGQVLALRLNVDCSAKGILPYGLGQLKMAPGEKFAGKTVSEVLSLCESALAGNNTTGYSISQLNEICDDINNNFDNGTDDDGVLVR
jgi:protocatechuate 3,4-dioxygenase beta subunit